MLREKGWRIREAMDRKLIHGRTKEGKTNPNCIGKFAAKDEEEAYEEWYFLVGD